MPTIRFDHPAQHSAEHPGPASPWQPGELLTVRITAVDDDGAYTAETVETYPADLKQHHAAELEQLQATHQAQLEAVRAGSSEERAGYLLELDRLRKAHQEAPTPT